MDGVSKMITAFGAPIDQGRWSSPTISARIMDLTTDRHRLGDGADGHASVGVNCGPLKFSDPAGPAEIARRVSPLSEMVAIGDSGLGAPRRPIVQFFAYSFATTIAQISKVTDRQTLPQLGTGRATATGHPCRVACGSRAFQNLRSGKYSSRTTKRRRPQPEARPRRFMALVP